MAAKPPMRRKVSARNTMVEPRANSATPSRRATRTEGANSVAMLSASKREAHDSAPARYRQVTSPTPGASSGAVTPRRRFPGSSRPPPQSPGWPARSQGYQCHPADHQRRARPAQPADPLFEKVFRQYRFHYVSDCRDRHRETEIGHGEQLHECEKRNRHGGHAADDEAVARQGGQGAADGPGTKVANLAVAPHAGRLQDFTGRGRAHHQRQNQPLHTGAALRGTVEGALPPTRATPAIINTIPAQRRPVMASWSSTLPISATTT